MAIPTDDYWRTCFVMMPYGVCAVKGVKIDFDDIYATLFKPAIQAVVVDGSKRLIAQRADQPRGSRLLHPTMFHDAVSARLALVDITSKNPNVHIELGFRYALLRTGTVVVRQKGTRIPFDLNGVSIPEYDYRPPAKANISRRLITKMLRETLRQNQADSPAYAAAQAFLARLGPPDRPTELGKLVLKAENLALEGDVRGAAQAYARAAALAPDLPLPHDRRGMLLQQAGDSAGALTALRTAEILRAPRHTRELKELFSTPDPTIAQMLGRPKPFTLNAQDEKLLNRIASKPHEEIMVRIGAPAGRNPDVLVIGPSHVYSTGAVPQILKTYGKVLDRGSLSFPDKGYVVSRYSIGIPKRQQRSAARDLAGGLGKLDVFGPKVNVKIGSGGSGGSGGFGGGGFGGGGAGFP
jgi:hypothetical protein